MQLYLNINLYTQQFGETKLYDSTHLDKLPKFLSSVYKASHAEKKLRNSFVCLYLNLPRCAAVPAVASLNKLFTISALCKVFMYTS